MVVCNRKILKIEVTRDCPDRLFDIGLHFSRERPILFNVGFFGRVLWISFFEAID